MPEKILSICIPTFNRAELLDETLSHLVLEPSFLLGKIEICISDNASPDSTSEIAKKYSDKYENIIYNRNKENTGIIDGNFPIVASMASGTFIKFLNDYASFIPGELDKLIKFIEVNEKEKPILFFPNNNLINETREIIYCNSFDHFVQTASYWTTWVLAAGFWKEDFLSIIDRDRSVEKFMWCPDNYLRLIDSGRKTIINNRKILQTQETKSKGGYNLFKIFGENYLSLYKPYLQAGKLQNTTYQIEKYKLLRYYLLPTTINYLLTPNYTFKLNNAFKILFKEYKWNLYFYFNIMRFIFLLSKRLAKPFIKKMI